MFALHKVTVRAAVIRSFHLTNVSLAVVGESHQKRHQSLRIVTKFNLAGVESETLTCFLQRTTGNQSIHVCLLIQLRLAKNKKSTGVVVPDQVMTSLALKGLQMDVLKCILQQLRYTMHPVVAQEENSGDS